MQKIDKGTGAKSSRSETVGIRLEPKLRYLAELAAREQQRTLSSFIAWAVKKALQGELLDEPNYGPDPRPKAPLPLRFEGFWDEEPSERFFLLATGRHDLLTDVEANLWKQIQEVPALKTKRGAIDRAKLREYWGDIVTSQE